MKKPGRTSTRRCAFLSMDGLGDFVSDDELLLDPLARRGWEVEMVPWRRTGVAWDRFEAVVIRTTWDYWEDPEGFLRVLGEIDRSRALLLNPLEPVRWNVEKTYLRDLEARGVGIVPTVWGRDLSPDGIARIRDELGSEDVIVKPVIGANAAGLHRLGPASGGEAEARAVRDLGDRAYLAQPFLPAVEEEGEFSLFYFGGDHSHTILKTPRPTDFRVQEEHGGRIRSVRAGSALRKAGRRAMDALDGVPLYARVDLVRGGPGRFALMELELVEPALYFRTDDEAPDRFAAALDERMRCRSP